MENVIMLHNQQLKNLTWLLITVGILLLDQATKFYATSLLSFEAPVVVFTGFNLTLAHNTGAAFSLFHQYNGGQLIFFTVLAISVSIYLLVWLYRLDVNADTNLKIAISLLLGGTIGNLIDRVSFGYVIDFIQLYYKNFYWPIFNIADSSITVGAALLIYAYARLPKGNNTN